VKDFQPKTCFLGASFLIVASNKLTTIFADAAPVAFSDSFLNSVTPKTQSTAKAEAKVSANPL
jgi:hypothetical protein